MSAAVIFSSIVALTLSPMMCSKLLKPAEQDPWLVKQIDKMMSKISGWYLITLQAGVKRPILVSLIVLISFALSSFLMNKIPQEFAPQEDRGSMFLMVTGPQGSSFEYIDNKMDEVEGRLMQSGRTA